MMILYKFFTMRQADTGAGIICFAMQPLQNIEHPICILLFETNAIALNRYHQLACFP